MPSWRVSRKASLSNQITHFGIMGGLSNSRVATHTNRATNTLRIPKPAAAGLQFMRMHNLLSKNPQGSGGVGRMVKTQPCNCTGVVKKTEITLEENNLGEDTLGDSLGDTLGDNNVNISDDTITCDFTLSIFPCKNIVTNVSGCTLPPERGIEDVLNIDKYCCTTNLDSSGRCKDSSNICINVSGDTIECLKDRNIPLCGCEATTEKDIPAMLKSGCPAVYVNTDISINNGFHIPKNQGLVIKQGTVDISNSATVNISGQLLIFPDASLNNHGTIHFSDNPSTPVFTQCFVVAGTMKNYGLINIGNSENNSPGGGGGILVIEQGNVTNNGHIVVKDNYNGITVGAGGPALALNQANFINNKKITGPYTLIDIEPGNTFTNNGNINFTAGVHPTKEGAQQCVYIKGTFLSGQSSILTFQHIDSNINNVGIEIDSSGTGTFHDVSFGNISNNGRGIEINGLGTFLNTVRFSEISNNGYGINIAPLGTGNFHDVSFGNISNNGYGINIVPSGTGTFHDVSFGNISNNGRGIYINGLGTFINTVRFSEISNNGYGMHITTSGTGHFKDIVSFSGSINDSFGILVDVSGDVSGTGHFQNTVSFSYISNNGTGIQMNGSAIFNDICFNQPLNGHGINANQNTDFSYNKICGEPSGNVWPQGTPENYNINNNCFQSP